MKSDIHPDEETLELYVTGSLSQTAAMQLERHVKCCSQCSRLLEQFHAVHVGLEAAGEQYRQTCFKGGALATIQAYEAGKRSVAHYVRAAFLIPAAACIGFIVLQLLPLERSPMNRQPRAASSGMDELCFSRPHMPSTVSLSVTLPSLPAFSASELPTFTFTIPRRPSGLVSAPPGRILTGRTKDSTKGVNS